MKSKIIHRSNIPGLKSIDANRIDVFLDYAPDKTIKAFHVERVDLSGLDLPENASVVLFCETSLEENVHPLGSVSKFSPVRGDLSQYNLKFSPLFRVIVFMDSDPKLLASSDNLRAKNLDENSGSLSLLHVRVASNLGNRLWKLEIGDRWPELIVNNNPEINLVNKIQDNMLIRGLILPEAISQILKYIIKKPDSDREWVKHWQTFVSTYGIDLEDAPEDEDEIEEFVDNIVMKWCDDLSLCEKIISFEESMS